MDLLGLHFLSSFLSVFAQMVAVIVVVYCTANFFSLKPGGSLKFAFSSLLYFFSSATTFAIATQLLMIISGQFRGLGGIRSLAGASILHVIFGLLVIGLYLRHITL